MVSAGIADAKPATGGFGWDGIWGNNGGASTVSVINETTGKVTAAIPVGSNPDGVAVDPTTHTAYVANLGGSVSVIDESSGTVTGLWLTITTVVLGAGGAPVASMVGAIL